MSPQQKIAHHRQKFGNPFFCTRGAQKIFQAPPNKFVIKHVNFLESTPLHMTKVNNFIIQKHCSSLIDKQTDRNACRIMISIDHFPWTLYFFRNSRIQFVVAYFSMIYGPSHSRQISKPLSGSLQTPYMFFCLRPKMLHQAKKYCTLSFTVIVICLAKLLTTLTKCTTF